MAKVYAVKGKTKNGREKTEWFECLPDAKKFADEHGWRRCEFFACKKVDCGTENRDEGKPSSFDDKCKGAIGKYLELNGYEVIDRDYSCPVGAADVVMYDGDELVFAVTKFRNGVEVGFPDEATLDSTRMRLENVAAYYLSENDIVNMPVRFDVIDLLVVNSDRAMIKHHKNITGSTF